ncbi:MAG: SGNH/GDSL hydrolase family protein [Acidobacteriota bacterium]
MGIGGTARRTLSVAARALDTGWRVIGLTLCAVLLLEGGLRVRYAWKHHKPGQELDPRAESDVYKGESWAYQYWDEFKRTETVSWKSYVYYRRTPQAGAFINIDDRGIRRTWAPAESHPRALIWMFGGSTLWGTGARDDFTIPSELSREMHARGMPVRVVNYGETGYVSTQDLLTFELELRGQAPPDLAVFYGAYNDVFSAYQSRVAGIPQNESHRIAEFQLYDQLNWRRGFIEKTALFHLARGIRDRLYSSPGSSQQWLPDSRVEPLAADVVRDYCANMRAAQSVARAHGVSVLIVWQPDFSQKLVLSDWEKTLIVNRSLATLTNRVLLGLRERQAALGPSGQCLDLSAIFHDEARTVFIDPVHISEEGDRTVAIAIASAVSEILRRCVGSEQGN